MSKPGWALLIYYFIMNASVIGFMIIDVVAQLLRGAVAGDDMSIENAMLQASESAWGYFFAAAVGLVLLLIWKKPPYFRYEIFAKGKSMNTGAFFCILSIFIGGQTIFQLGTSLLELLLNAFGYTISEGLASLETDPDNFSMFLYAGILAPVAEEILFRGFVQRTMLPFGKKFAILVSSLTFGLFHGNLLQTPYAFVVGLEVDRELRRERISKRLRARLQEGMVDEVRALLETGVAPDDLIYYGLEYKYLTLYLTGQLSYEAMVHDLEIAIHQFAKRQMTWFRGMQERRGIEINWINPSL